MFLNFNANANYIPRECYRMNNDFCVCVYYLKLVLLYGYTKAKMTETDINLLYFFFF